jgi:hypothetical protein
MPVTNIHFSLREMAEIHLVRGPAGQSTEDLRRRLWVTLPDDSRDTFFDYAATHNDVRILFSPNFKVQTETSTEFQGFDISVNKKTGKVSVKRAPGPSPAPSNFVLEASVTQNTGGPANVPSAFLRVHVHERVERVWFTPSSLSVRARPGSDPDEINYPYAVRAEFDDGTVADVTHSPELTFSPSSRMSGPYVRIPASASPGDVLPVTVKTSAKWNSRSATGEIKVLHPWETEPDPPVAEWIDGNPNVLAATATPPPSPSEARVTLRPEAVPNVLFLGCGFTGAEVPAFEKITDRIVHELRKNTMLRPFALLATSMNYWRLAIPAAKPGISVRCEVAPRLTNGVLVANPMPSPVSPPANMADWWTEHLVFVVGLPVRSDLALVKDATTDQPLTTVDSIGSRYATTFDFTNLFKKWNLTARAHPGHTFDQVNPGAALEWLKLAERTFIDEVDNYPPVSIGLPPATDRPQTNRFSAFDARGSDKERQAFFRRITAKPRGPSGPVALDGTAPDNALGNLWITDPATRAAFKFDNRDYVTVFSNIPFGQIDSGIHMRLEAVVSTASDKRSKVYGIPVARVAGRRALTYDPPVLTEKSIDSITWHTFAHELAHTLHVGDEYTGAFGTFADPEASLNRWGNLTTAGTAIGADGKVRVDQIKWNWHRIRKASVLTRAVKDMGGGVVHVYVGPARALQFSARNSATQRPGDKVRLRRRKKHTVLGRPPVTVTSSVEFEVMEIHDTNIDDPTDRRSMTLVLKPDGPVDISPFDEGSLVYIPVPAPENIRSVDRPYLTLVPPAAERIMREIGGPMNGKDCDPDMLPVDVPVKKDPAGTTPDNILTHLVGVYFGGDRHVCGILHPVGGCLMRTSESSPEGTPIGVSAFCPVCRYVLVDYVDPEQHWANDLDYNSWFPL